jgi:predicted amidohydrolase YtcJ
MQRGKQAGCRLILVLAFVGQISIFSPAQTKQSAEVIVTHARLYTVNAKQPWAEAIAIAGDKIVAVGRAQEIDAWRGPATKIVDAQGKLVLPGFTDCHIHFIEGSLAAQRLQLDDAEDLPEILRRVKAYGAAHPELPWVIGRGWNYASVGPTHLPDKKDLDAIFPDRPVYLEAFDGHSWWANSKALALAGITRETANPAGGEIVRDPKTGEPTGAIKEDAADALMENAIPLPGREQRLTALRAGLKEANRLGLVRVHSAAGITVADSDLKNVDLYEELRRRGELTVRFYMAYRLDPPRVTEQQVAEVEQARQRYHDEWIAAGAVKFFLDGVIESHTAAMLEPYSDDPKISGTPFWGAAAYQQAVTEFDKRGIQIFSHAVGDRAIRQALDAYETAAQVNGTKDARHRIEHIETVAAADIPRFGKLGVIASMQPLHADPNDDTLLAWAKNIGPDRVSRGWPWHSILASGGVLGFGSDWPVVTQNPWIGLQTAVTRQTTGGLPKEGFVPAERISIEQAVRAYTLDAALAGHREKTEGSLEPGKLADLIVVDQNIFETAAANLSKTKVLLTMVGGRVVYELPDWTAKKAATEKN